MRPVIERYQSPRPPIVSPTDILHPTFSNPHPASDILERSPRHAHRATLTAPPLIWRSPSDHQSLPGTWTRKAHNPCSHRVDTFVLPDCI